VTREEGQKYSTTNGLRFYEVSSVTKESIPQVFEDLLFDYSLPTTPEEKEKTPVKGEGKGKKLQQLNLEKEEGPPVFVDNLRGEMLETVLETVAILPPKKFFCYYYSTDPSCRFLLMRWPPRQLRWKRGVL